MSFMFVTMDPCSLTTPVKIEAERLLWMSWRKGVQRKAERWFGSSVILCVCAWKQESYCRTQSESECLSPFLVFTSSPLGASCHSLFLSVHFSHLSAPPISFSHMSPCTVLVLFSCWLPPLKKIEIKNLISIFSSHSSFLYWTLTRPLCLPTFLKILR